MQNFREEIAKLVTYLNIKCRIFCVWFHFQNIEHNLQICWKGLLVQRSTNHQYPNSLLFLIMLFRDFQTLMHRIKKLSGLLFMLPHFRNMERYLKCFFGFCSDCFSHHNNGEVKQGTLAADCSSWRNTLHKQLKLGEEKLIVMADEQRACRKDSSTRPETTHKCDLCNRDCHSHIGLFSDRRRCSNWADSLEVSTHGQPWPTGASQGRDCKTPLTSLAQCHFLFLSLL